MSVMELQQPRTLIPRWSGHGDLRILVDHPYVWLLADDVERLAGIPPWGRGATLLLDDGALVEHAGAEYYPLGAAIARGREEGTPRAAEFLAWLDEQLPALLAPEVLEHAHRPVGFAEAFTVQRAARILRDEGYEIGRTRLFEQLEQLGWIERVDPESDWVITAVPHQRDWLTLRTVKIPAGGRDETRPYLQVHVTPAGLDELRRTLTPPARHPAAVPLFEPDALEQP